MSLSLCLISKLNMRVDYRSHWDLIRRSTDSCTKLMIEINLSSLRNTYGFLGLMKPGHFSSLKYVVLELVLVILSVIFPESIWIISSYFLPSHATRRCSGVIWTAVLTVSSGRYPLTLTGPSSPSNSSSLGSSPLTTSMLIKLFFLT